MNQIIIFTAEFEQNLVAVERTRQYFNNPLEDIKLAPAVSPSLHLENGQGGIQDPVNSAIVFDDVCLSYNFEDEAKEVSYALKKVSFCIKKGEKVAFCGR